MDLVCFLQTQAAKSRILSHWSVRLSRLLQGVAYRRLGHDGDHGRNGEEQLLETLGPRITTFIDVGANVGTWTALLLKYSPTASGLLLEPMPTAAARCQERFQGHENVSIVQVAAGASDGTVDMAELPNASTHSSIVVRPPGALILNVPLRSVDSLLVEHNLLHVDFIKIDAEGFDFWVLAGLASAIEGQRIEAIQFEYNESWQLTSALLESAIDMLERNSYRVFLVAHGGLWEFDISVYGEFYNHSNFVALSPKVINYCGQLIIGRA